jgi:putative ABC transport system permease protein
LSIADLGSGVLHAGDRTASGPAKIFGFDEIYAAPDESIVLVAGDRSPDGAVVSVEAGRRLDIGVGDEIEVDLPDGSSLRIDVTGVADLSRTRPLFSSRRGGDLETFVYVENAVAVSSQTFADVVFPAFERAAAAGSGRLKSPPIREVDLRLDRELLDADPATAADETAAIAARVTAIADGQDYLLDNITNTLHVATDDAAAAKRLFVVLGLPGALLAAMLSAYAGNVLAEAQRREQAILRIRGASRRRLLRMLAWRTTLLTSVGAVLGLAAGYLAAAALLGRTSLDRAGAARLISSSLTGALAGFAATGAALYVTGRRSIDREIAEDRARLTARQPLWRRSRLDLIGLVVVVVVTAWAVRADRFAGTPGSVYFGRAVELDLWLLILPLTVWITGSLGLARLVTQLLRRTVPASTPSFGRVGRGLVRRSVGRRPWAIGNAVVVTSLIVALTTCLAVFTASYDAAKVDDARYANGADIRITPGPSVDREYGASDTAAFRTSGVDEVTPVVYALSNVILRSDRTSDPANLAAVDPASFAAVAPVSRATAQQLSVLADDPSSILVSADMADFLHADIGDTLHVLLARATPDQAEIDVVIAGLYERLPGFPEGADAVIDISAHTTAVPTKHPDFFLASTGRPGGRSGDAALDAAVDDLRRAVATSDVRIDTRATTLDRDQSSLAALNIAGLADLDAVFALGMATVAVAIFVFGLLLQRRREYVTLRAQGLERRRVRALILAEAAVVAACGTIGGLVVGVAMGYYFVAVLRPLFVLDPGIVVPAHSLLLSASLVVAATWISAGLGSRLVNRLDPIELLRED